METEGQLTEWQQKEFVRCAQDFYYFAEKYLKVVHPKRGPVNFKLYDYQKRAIGNFEDYRFNIVKKFRQGGLTTLAVLWALWRCMFKLDQRILIMSRTDRESVLAGKIAASAIRYMKEDHPWLAPNLIDNAKHEKTFDTGSVMWCYTPEGGRGKSATYMIIDEAAFIDNMEEYWMDMFPIVATGGNVIVISTVNGLGNWYQETYQDALDGLNDFHVIHLEYTEHPDYRKKAWEDEMRRQLGPRGWDQEILGKFLGSGNNYIKSEILGELDIETKKRWPLKKLFSEWDSDKKLSNLNRMNKIFGSDDEEWESGALWLWKEPIDGHGYVIGADAAEGVGEDGDQSAFVVLDMQTCEEVAEFYSNSVPPHIFAMILAKIGDYYHDALLAVENQSAGIAVIDKLQHSLYYSNLYYHRVKTQERPGLKLDKTKRPVVLEAMQDYIENKLVRINGNRLVRELYTFIFNREAKRAEARKGYHDDLIMSLAIALHVREQHTRDIPLGVSLPTNIVEDYRSNIMEKVRLEIEDSSPLDILKKNNDEMKSWEHRDVIPGVMFPFDRPNEGLLKEFDW